MSNNLFIPNWESSINNTLIDRIYIHLESDNSIALKDFNFHEYIEGITFGTEIRENGMYIFRFTDGRYYVGKASSCTLLERNAKHIDGRKDGSFNYVLRSLIPVSKEQKHFPENQQEFLKAKVVLLPISWDLLIKNNKNPKTDKPLHKLESDLIYLFKKHFPKMQIINKTNPKELSGYFEFRNL